MIEYEEVNVGGWTLIVGGQKEMTTASITGLRPLTHYDIRVAAFNSAGIGPFANSSNASTSGITEYMSLQKRGGCFDQCVWLPQLHYMTITCPGM